VFHESDPSELHARHPFSYSRPASSLPHEASASDEPVAFSTTPDTAFDVVALDCEMVYTTGGLRVARVSVIDGSGTTVFDELVRMDDGVDVMSVAS
jgi:RNA exonuclease 1